MPDRTASHVSQAIAELAARLQGALGEGYEVGRPLGSGGFAVVYLVRDLQLKRQLAVKVLSPDLITSATMIERFRREAEAIAGLSHPNIVPLHFIGQKDDLLYLAMACVEGGSLADRLTRDTQLPIDDATRILTEVASALAHAHKRGIIHRDIKPQNVLLDAESGRALVTDFGIARTLDATSITASGLVLGTPAYLAPEQVAGEASDHRVDIYALGVMGYEILTGRPPFEAPTASAVLMKRLGAPPPPVTTVRPEVPPILGQVVDTCLATVPDDRFESAGDIVRILTGRTPSSGGHLTSTRRVARGASRRSLWIGAGVVAVVAAALGWAALNNSRNAAQPVTPAVSPVDSGMVLIAAGDYPIGFDSGPATAAFRPAHRVTLGAFGIDRNEVTVGDYRTYVDSMKMPAPWPLDSVPPAAHPVTRVTVVDATSYCRWKHPAGGRLPTEEEWEAAARGATGRRFPWGDAPVGNRANVASGARASPAPAGTFAGGATPEGIQDMIGNVWEWTSSSFRAYPNGPAIADSFAQHRVIRGGAFNTYASIATPWWRQPVPPGAPPEQLDKTGFRCAMNAR
jgi:formylglycine-generating enzyme required for sulfatase activity/tRNA A-37 threonylcarbamoyl transferase component Bud32